MLNGQIVSCDRCPRLREWCLNVAKSKKREFSDEDYWGLPVPNFGDPLGKGLILGLAPAAHGANRTGRMFSGDRSGDWLYAALHSAGLANTPDSRDMTNGLTLSNVLITATCHCAPPDNKPTREEIENCAPYLASLLANNQFRAVLCLGSLAWTSALSHFKVRPKPKFGHGCETVADSGQTLLGSYHPSQQNTFTGRLTRDMLDDVVARFAMLIDPSTSSSDR